MMALNAVAIEKESRLDRKYLSEILDEQENEEKGLSGIRFHDTGRTGLTKYICCCLKRSTEAKGFQKDSLFKFHHADGPFEIIPSVFWETCK